MKRPAAATKRAAKPPIIAPTSKVAPRVKDVDMKPEPDESAGVHEEDIGTDPKDVPLTEEPLIPEEPAASLPENAENAIQPKQHIFGEPDLKRLKTEQSQWSLDQISIVFWTYIYGTYKKGFCATIYIKGSILMLSILRSCATLQSAMAAVASQEVPQTLNDSQDNASLLSASTLPLLGYIIYIYIYTYIHTYTYMP